MTKQTPKTAALVFGVFKSSRKVGGKLSFGCPAMPTSGKFLRRAEKSAESQVSVARQCRHLKIFYVEQKNRQRVKS
ncbi:MAG: hypothetical protein UCN61_04650, partial [Ruminococcus sp.]|nr:hypothetical protein [Ruminococcus sp.]